MSIFFSNAAGQVVGRVLDTVSQGSALANSVVLIAPFASSNAVTVAYTLPNGINTQPFMLTPAPELVQNLQDAEGRAINAWSGLIPDAVTEFAGKVTVQFYVYTAYSSANNTANTILATVSDFITVNKGVRAVLPSTPSQTIYEQILANFAALGTEIDNISAKIDGLLTPIINSNTIRIGALETAVGTITLTYNPTTHILALQKNGQPLGNSIDLPLESTVVGGRFDEDTHELILTLQGGDEITIPLNDIIDGLVNSSQIVQTLDNPNATTIPSTQAVSDFVKIYSENVDEVLREEINSALRSLTFDGTTLKFAYGVESGEFLPENLGAVTIPIAEIQRRLDSIAKWVFGIVGTIVTITDTYSRRTTAGGLDVADATETKVESITGDTRCDTIPVDLTTFFTNGYERNGITYEHINEYTVRISGTPTATWINTAQVINPSWLEVGKTYTFWHDVYTRRSMTGFVFGWSISVFNGDTREQFVFTEANAKTITIQEGYTYRVALYGENITVGTPIDWTASFMVNEGSTPDASLTSTTFEGIKSTGRNLLDIEGLLGGAISGNGFTVTPNNNTVTLTGKPTISGAGYANWKIATNPSFLQVGKTYTFYQTSGINPTYGNPRFGLRVWEYEGDNTTPTYKHNTSYSHFQVNVVEGYRYVFWLEADSFATGVEISPAVTVSFMVCEGTTKIPYEPYTESEILLADATSLACNDTIAPKEQVLTRATKTIVFDGTADNGGIGYWEATATQAPKGVFRFYTNDANYRIAVNAHLAPSVSNLGYTSVATIPDSVDYVYELINVGSTPTQFWVKNSNFADQDPTTALSNWLAYLTALNTAGTPLTIVYKGEQEIRESAIIGDSYEVWNGGTESLIGSGEITVEQSYIEEAANA